MDGHEQRLGQLTVRAFIEFAQIKHRWGMRQCMLGDRAVAIVMPFLTFRFLLPLVQWTRCIFRGLLKATMVYHLLGSGFPQITQ